MSAKRSFLLLQGVCSPFFFRLGQALRVRGHQVLKLHFNGGDWLYWLGQPAWCYRGAWSGLRTFLAEKYRKFNVTDQILFGDCRPVHRPAIELAAQCGVRTHVLEEGYFRPYWVTLERDGVNGYSRLPREADWYRTVGKQLPEYRQGQPVTSSFRIRAIHDVLYHLAGVSNPFFFPGYQTHAPITAPMEYIGYIRRLPMLRFHRQRDDDLLLHLLRKGTPYFLLPLQLSSDAQIQHHSRFTHMAEIMEHVLHSFALHAPSEAALVIKNHPLDPGLDHHPQTIRRLVDRFALDGRVHYMETGDLLQLLRHATGTVTVNSTVGILSLVQHIPTITLGNPIYNIPGLTFQGPLEVFWKNGERPLARLFRLFRNTVIHLTQINGGLYTRQGIGMLVDNCVPVLEAQRSRLEEWI